MAPTCRSGRFVSKGREHGFSYMVALFAVAIIGVMSTRAMQNLQTMEQREREDDLLFVGQAYLRAIAQYHDQSPGTVKRYPPDLQSLLLDERAVRVRRPLRRLYSDPVGKSNQWGTVEAPDGGVMGVYSLSPQTPVKRTGFPAALEQFEGATSYQDWKFVYIPGVIKEGT
jgi:type II secretory pathway pseudopilin PulG